jgi:hypothetical protein
MSTAAQLLAELRSVTPVTVKCGHCPFETFAPLDEAAPRSSSTSDRPRPDPEKRRPSGATSLK